MTAGIGSAPDLGTPAVGDAGSAAGAAPAGIAWNVWFRRRITDSSLCPVCTGDQVLDGVCRSCAADLRGDSGQEIWEASRRAAMALEARERLMLAAVPQAGSGAAPVPVSASDRPGPAGSRRTAARSDTTVQSLFALAGAGLVAVAAIVFTFFNPDLENRVVRSAIVGLVTLLFLGAAWWLARRGTRFSAEAVGWLGVVFLGIDVWAFSRIGEDGRQSWLLAAVATAILACISLRLGALSGLRCWSSAAVIGIAIVPAMLGYSGGGAFALALGHLGVVVAASALREWLPVLREEPGDGLRVSSEAAATRLGTRSSGVRIALSALQVGAALSAVPALAAGLIGSDAPYTAGALLLGFAAAAVFAARHSLSFFWSLVAGAAGTAVLPSLAIAAQRTGDWQIVLLTGGAALGGVVVAAVAPRLPAIVRPALGWAAVSVPAVCSLPAALFLAAQFLPAVLGPDEASEGWRQSLPFLVSGAVVAVASALFAKLATLSAPPQNRASLNALSALCAVVSVVFAELTALVSLKLVLAASGIEGIALESIVASVGLLLAIVVTLVPRVAAREWSTVLVVSAVPFLIGIAGVTQQRSGWTALTTVGMCVLALALLVTRREWLGGYLRVIAAALLVPSLAVTAVCLGAELLDGSASPVVLPVIAALVALALAGSGILPDLLGRRGPFLRPVSEARLALEVSALVTGAIAVWLSLERVASGLGTACIVLLLIGIGAALMAALGRRRYGWWLAGAALTGSLWCVLGLRGAQALEAYLLPPSLGAALVALVLSAGGSRRTDLYAVGLGAAISPVLVMLAMGGTGAVPRAIGLLAASWALLVAGALFARSVGSRSGSAPGSTSGDGTSGGAPTALSALAAPSFAAAMLAGLAGAIRASELGLAGASFALCLPVSAIGAGAMLLAGRGLRRALPRLRKSLWPEVPGTVALAAGCWCAIDRDWGAIWSMWGLMLAYLVAMVVVVRRRLSGLGPLIPAAALFGVAFATGIVAWSPRELRVEVFSLPLGLMLLLAGALALRDAGGLRPAAVGSGSSARPGLTSGSGSTSASAQSFSPGALARWPLELRGSWALLGPGIVVTMLASILSTFTDPQTWRAILVMVIALVAMLLGAWLRLAAPFVLGLIVLPVENVFVFAVQIGRGIDSMPWWITLATIGSVLLSVAVFTEQRSGERQTLMARVRDLR